MGNINTEPGKLQVLREPRQTGEDLSAKLVGPGSASVAPTSGPALRAGEEPAGVIHNLRGPELFVPGWIVSWILTAPEPEE